MRYCLKSLWDVNWFRIRILERPGRWRFVFSAALFLVGLIVELRDLQVTLSPTFIVWALIMATDVISYVRRWLQGSSVILTSDFRIPQILQDLTLTREYEDQGYQVEAVPCRPDEYVVRSATVDGYLRSSDGIRLEVDQTLRQPVDERLKGEAVDLENALRCQLWESCRADPPRLFVNESKTCLGKDVFAHVDTLRIYRGSYFHSFLTNELATRVLESRGESPTWVYEGKDFFTEQEREGRPLLKSISSSHMGNHIGISTLAHTADGKLILWRQSSAAQQNRGLLVPSGSGSCDWADWEELSGRETLHELVAAAMEREFREESCCTSEGVLLSTAILGHFRWVRRGGKPEFVGITKAGLESIDVRPETEEVDAPSFLKVKRPAATLSQLRESVDLLLESDRLSVPLWVNLTCLKEALDTEEERWKAFLDLG